MHVHKDGTKKVWEKGEKKDVWSKEGRTNARNGGIGLKKLKREKSAEEESMEGGKEERWKDSV